MQLTLITPPAELPLSMDEVRAHCRVDGPDDDDVLAALIEAAVGYLDGPHGILGRAIVQQVWRADLTGWFDAVALPIDPVLSVVISYFDADGIEQVVPDTAYDLTRPYGCAPLLRWVSGVAQPALDGRRYPVRVAITAGHGDADVVPQGIKAALKMLVEHWFSNRGVVAPGSVAQLPVAIDALLARFRRML